MAKAPKIFQPLIATANTLRAGDVVFRTQAGLWSRDISKAYVAQTQDDASHLQTAADADSAANRVVDVALIPVSSEPGAAIRPSALRERIRAEGPSISLPRDGSIVERSPIRSYVAQDI